TAAWYRRVFYNLEKQINTLVGLSDYTAFQTPSPLNGEPVTIYNLNRAKQGLVDLIDTTSTDRDTSRQTYDGLELSFSARLPRGAAGGELGRPGERISRWTANPVGDRQPHRTRDRILEALESARPEPATNLQGRQGAV